MSNQLNTHLNSLTQWGASALGVSSLVLQPVSGDASFRKYYRTVHNNISYIAVSAPPATEKNHEFVAFAALLRDANILVPKVFAVDYEHGFMLLSDLGDQLLLPLLSDFNRADLWYKKAINELIKLQHISHTSQLLPYSDAVLQTELDVCPEWFLSGLLKLSLNDTDLQILAQTNTLLIEAAVNQPQRVVHRDYHARNIMCVDDQLAMIDFQDALWGPVSYDVVSLLKDCYIRWPREQVLAWVSHYHEAISPVLAMPSLPDFVRQFDLMGLQRHIKVLGVFARLSQRDGKHAYLADLPRVMAYVQEAASLYPELHAFNEWFATRVVTVAQQADWFTSS